MEELGLAARQGYDQGYARIAKVRYSHDAMIDQIITEPMVSQDHLAQVFGYTPAWVSRIIGSDAFQARLAERKGELTDPLIVASIEERLKGLAMFSIQKVMEKLETNPTMDGALKALELSTKALGYGAKQQNVNVQQNFVALLPAKSESVGGWLEEYGPQVKRPVTVEQLGPELAGLVEQVSEPASVASLATGEAADEGEGVVAESDL